MNSGKNLGLALIIAAAMALPASAQVERVVVEAQGISRACSPGLETALKNLDSVYQYAISVPKQMFSVTYYRGEKFEPKDLRWAADKGEAEIVRFHVSASGKVVDEGDHQVFLSGDDKYQIVGDKKLPTGVPIGMIGVVDDQAKPMMTMQPDDYKLLTEGDANGDSPAPAKSLKPEQPDQKSTTEDGVSKS